MRGDDVVLMLTSVGTEEQALDIAHALVRLHYAACVNMIPSVRSIYRWKGKLCDDSEYLLIIKTLAREYPNVSATIQEINSYELPEILSVSLRDADARFCDWILASTGKPKPRAPRKPAGPPKSLAAAGSKRRKRVVEVAD
jgi:periplasmic divalent cation tolerance protein